MENDSSSDRSDGRRSLAGGAPRRKKPKWPYVEPAELRRLRGLFLATIATEAPAVLTDLKENVFRSVNPSARTVSNHNFPSPLEDWAERQLLWDSFSGAGRWIIDVAEATLKYWDGLPALPKTLRWCPGLPVIDLTSLKSDDPAHRAEASKALRDLDGVLSFSSPTWDPSTEKWEIYRKRASAEYLIYFDGLREKYDNIFKRTYEYKTTRKEAERHITWLVRSQLFGESAEAIRKYYLKKNRHEAKPRDIQVAIRSMAHILFGEFSESWLRKPKVGRPPRKSR